jgi:hypothetical protein
MSNGTGDLVQTTLESWSDNSWCGATTGQWCVRASVFGSFGQLDGDGSPVSGTDHVRIEYNLESDGETWTQYVPRSLLTSEAACGLTLCRTVTNALTGAALSSYSLKSGPYMTG